MSEVSISIITLLSKGHLERKEFVAHIDVVLSKHAESTAKKREEKEGFVNDQLCLNKAGISPPIKTNLDKNKQVEICFEISGCLEPKIPFIEGQNILLFHEGSKHECKRSIPLKAVHSKAPVAAITFKTKDNKYLHQVVIDVPSDILPAPEVGPDVGMNVLGSTSDLSQSTMNSPQNSMQSSRSSNASSSSDFGIPEGAITVMTDSCRSMTLDEGEQRCSKLLSEESLLNLAKALGPQDGFALVICLGVESNVHNANVDNFPRDIVRALVASLSIWNQKCDDAGKKFDELVDKLRRIGRNDIKSTILKCYEGGDEKLEFL